MNKIVYFTPGVNTFSIFDNDGFDYISHGYVYLFHTKNDSEFIDAYENKERDGVCVAAYYLQKHHPLAFAVAVNNKDHPALRRLLIRALKERC